MRFMVMQGKLDPTDLESVCREWSRRETVSRVRGERRAEEIQEKLVHVLQPLMDESLAAILDGAPRSTAKERNK